MSNDYFPVPDGPCEWCGFSEVFCYCFFKCEKCDQLNKDCECDDCIESEEGESF